jgi:glutamyl-tRNA reductase
MTDSAYPARLLLFGWNFRVTESAVRDRIAFTAEEVREGLKSLVGRGIVAEGVIVSTCHRSEIYGLVGDEPHRGAPIDELLPGFLSEWRGVEARDLARTAFRREGTDAARHLFRVASGLDSMALGESEVLGQVRQALRLARESGSTRAVLHRLFESALAAGKRVRSQTEIARHPLSVVSIGFELVTKVFGDLASRTVLVLGAGDTGTLFARQAAEAGVRDLRIANRTPEAAERVAGQVRGIAVRWEEVSREMAESDVVVGTTASPRPVVRRDDVENAMRLRRGKPMFFLDLAVPPDVDPAVRDVYNTFVYGVNDLEGVAEENRRRRAREIPVAEAILEEELAKFMGWMGNLSVIPTLTELKGKFDRIRDEELARLPEGEREKFRAFAESLAARMLHEPMRRLKSEPETARRLDRVEAVRHLFGLDAAPESKSGSESGPESEPETES